MSRWVIKNNSNNDCLMHYGIPGMKWGVRNFIDENGHLTEAGKQRYANPKTTFQISSSLSKKKQAMESAKDRIKALTGKGFGKKNKAATEEKKRLREQLKIDREEFKNAKAAERAKFREQQQAERDARRQERANLNSIHNYINGNKRLMKAMEKNNNLRFKSGQNKKIDFEQVIGTYNKRSQADIDARKARNKQNMQNLKNENENLRNMDIREATSEKNMSKIRYKYTKPKKR